MHNLTVYLMVEKKKKGKKKKKKNEINNLRRCNWASSLSNSCAINVVVNTRLDISFHHTAARSHLLIQSIFLYAEIIICAYLKIYGASSLLFLRRCPVSLSSQIYPCRVLIPSYCWKNFSPSCQIS